MLSEISDFSVLRVTIYIMMHTVTLLRGGIVGQYIIDLQSPGKVKLRGDPLKIPCFRHYKHTKESSSTCALFFSSGIIGKSGSPLTCYKGEV